MLSAVIFDFDGVIVDTEPFHHRAFEKTWNPEGISYSWQEYMEYFIGFDDRDALREAYQMKRMELSDAQLNQMLETKAQAFQDIIHDEGAVAYPGTVELIRALSEKIPVGLCSGAVRSDVDPVLGWLGIEDCFKSIVTADNVSASKPDPECYSLCVKLLGEQYPKKDIRAEQCVAIEDTPTGIQSARRAGLAVLGVSNTYEAEKLQDAQKVVSSLAHVTIQDFESVISGDV